MSQTCIMLGDSAVANCCSFVGDEAVPSAGVTKGASSLHMCGVPSQRARSLTATRQELNFSKRPITYLWGADCPSPTRLRYFLGGGRSHALGQLCRNLGCLYTLEGMQEPGALAASLPAAGVPLESP